MSSNSTLRPIGNNLLVEINTEENKAGDIIIISDNDAFLRGRVRGISPHLLSAQPVRDGHIQVGSMVMFPRDAKELVSVGENLCIVPLGAVVGVVDGGENKPGMAKNPFFELPCWASFIEQESEYERIWKKWEQVRDFEFRVGFMEPFVPVDDIGREMYAACTEVLGPNVAGLIDPFAFQTDKPITTVHTSEGTREDSKGTGRTFAVVCTDDFWDGMLYYTGEHRILGFQKKKTTMRAIVETVPTWMSAFHRVLKGAAFRRIAGPECERVLFTTIHFNQSIRLEGKGNYNDPVRNSDCMSHFLTIGMNDAAPEISPTLKTLGLTSANPPAKALGRVDVKFSYTRDIAGRQYLVWLNIRAPKNEDSKLLNLDWEIQEVRPVNVVQLQYGDLIPSFIRDVVFRSFYKTWLDGIQCSAIS